MGNRDRFPKATAHDPRHSEMEEIKGKYITAASKLFAEKGLKGFAEILTYVYDG